MDSYKRLFYNLDNPSDMGRAVNIGTNLLCDGIQTV